MHAPSLLLTSGDKRFVFEAELTVKEDGMLTRSTTHAELMKRASEIFQVLLMACSVTEGCLSNVPMRFRAHCTLFIRARRASIGTEGTAVGGGGMKRCDVLERVDVGGSTISTRWKKRYCRRLLRVN